MDNLRALPWVALLGDCLDRPAKQRIQNLATEYNQRASWNALVLVDQITPSRLILGSSR